MNYSKKTILLSLLPLIFLSGCFNEAKAEDNKIPSFIQVGKYYAYQFNSTEKIKVLKIDKSGWIEVENMNKYRKSPMWINVSNMLTIREIDKQDLKKE